MASKFTKYAGSINVSDKDFEQVRTSPTGQGMVQIPPGRYPLQCTSVKADYEPKGKYAYVDIAGVVYSGDEEGGQITQRIFLKKDQKRVDIPLENIARVFKALDPDLVESIEACSSPEEFIGQIEEWAEGISELKPYFEGRVSIEEYKGKEYSRLQVLRYLTEEEAEEYWLEEDSEEEDSAQEESDEEEDEDEEEDDEEEETAEDDDEDEEDDEDDEDEEIVIEKGGEVSWKPPKAKKTRDFEVVTSNRSKQTCTLKESGGNRIYKNVAWSDVSPFEPVNSNSSPQSSKSAGKTRRKKSRR